MTEIRYVQLEDRQFWYSLDKHLPEKEFEKKVRDKQGVFCKHFLEKVAKYFWRMLHLQIGEKCKAFPKALRNGAAPGW